MFFLYFGCHLYYLGYNLLDFDWFCRIDFGKVDVWTRRLGSTGYGEDGNACYVMAFTHTLSQPPRFKACNSFRVKWFD